MTTTHTPAIRLARRVLFPETEIAVADLVDTSVRRRLLALAPEAPVVVVTIPDGRGDPLPIAMLARMSRTLAGAVALLGLRRVRLVKAPRGSSGQAIWSPIVDDDRGGSVPELREIVTLIALSKLVASENAAALQASSGRARHRNALARTTDRCFAVPGLGVAFEVQALGLVELDVDARLALLAVEVRRLIEKRPLDDALAQRVRALTAPVPLAEDEPAKPAPSAAPVRPAGAVVWGDRYVVEGLIGKGGQGTTWRALDEKTGAIVALKAFDLAKAAEWKKVELFEREVETLRALAHARIPRFLDVVDKGQARALVMSFVPGDDLETIVSRRGPFTPEEVRAVVEQMLDVLVTLHARAVVHRDVKPRNIIRRPDGTEHTLVDFGGVTRAKDTAGSTIVGTFGFMAPEQLYGAQSAATDLYALGATAVALATGKQPEELPRRGLGIDVDAAVPSLPPQLRTVLASMLEPDPQRRAQDAAAVLAALTGTGAGGVLAWFKRALAR